MAWYIVIGLYCWGKAQSIPAAIVRCKAAYPSGLLHKPVSRMGYDVWEVAQDADIDELGNIVSSVRPVKILEVRFKGDKVTTSTGPFDTAAKMRT